MILGFNDSFCVFLLHYSIKLSCFCNSVFCICWNEKIYFYSFIFPSTVYSTICFFPNHLWSYCHSPLSSQVDCLSLNALVCLIGPLPSFPSSFLVEATWLPFRLLWSCSYCWVSWWGQSSSCPSVVDIAACRSLFYLPADFVIVVVCFVSVTKHV